MDFNAIFNNISDRYRGCQLYCWRKPEYSEKILQFVVLFQCNAPRITPPFVVLVSRMYPGLPTVRSLVSTMYPGLPTIRSLVSTMYPGLPHRS